MLSAGSARHLSAAVVAALLALPAAADAAVTATADAAEITVTGTAGNDTASISADGANIRVTNATAGTGCEAAGSDALCASANRTLVVSLGDGLDAYDSSATIATLVLGGPDADRLFGGPAPETLRGDAGDDKLEGAGGDDVIVPGPGNDAAKGGAGRDTISFALDAAAVTVDLSAPTGEAAGGEFEILIGSPHGDNLTASAGLQRIDGGAGVDGVSYAGRGAGGFVIDLAAGAAGPPGTVETQLASIERATGSPGNDTLIGTSEANLLDGGAGDDTLRGGAGGDFMAGGDGVDTIDLDHLAAGSPGDAGITHTLGAPASANSEGDASFGVENARGSARADRITGTSADNVIDGGPGNDTIAPRGGSDRLTGGAGTDTLDYSASAVPVHMRLGGANARRVREFASPATVDTTTDEFEAGIGSAFADVLAGSSGANVLFGLAGADVIDGGAGGDLLDGGNGNDRFGRLTSSAADLTAARAKVGAARSRDGADTVRGGAGNDTIDVRDGLLDLRVDCGPGTDRARQDHSDDRRDLDLDGCETRETSAVDQGELTQVRSVGARRNGARTLRMSCPRASRVTCRGTASLSNDGSRSGRRRTSYRIRRGSSARVRVRGSGRYVVLSERDQRRRIRRVAERI